MYSNSWGFPASQTTLATWAAIKVAIQSVAAKGAFVAFAAGAGGARRCCTAAAPSPHSDASSYVEQNLSHINVGNYGSNNDVASQAIYPAVYAPGIPGMLAVMGTLCFRANVFI